MAKKRKEHVNEGPDPRFEIMLHAALFGITPEDYAEFYKDFHTMTGTLTGMRKRIILNEEAPDEDASGPGCGQWMVREPAKALADAAQKTLILRVQMQGVTKPPMWRELKVPADFNFLQLHKAIQRACGFENYHLWQFQRKAYDPELQIGLPAAGDEMGLEDCTHDAGKTGITAFLAEKGDKLVYVYDFGDDWIFTVSVVKVTPRDGETAECIRWKSDLQPIEDCGGVWGYLNLRQGWMERDTLTKAQKKELVDSIGCDSFSDWVEIMEDSMFDPETVNRRLAEI